MEQRRNTKGRPTKHCPPPPQRSPPCDVEPPTTPVWTTETTEFGPIQRGPFGQVLLPPGIFEEILENKENLVNSM
jgi:hypothetical protein